MALWSKSLSRFYHSTLCVHSSTVLIAFLCLSGLPWLSPAAVHSAPSTSDLSLPAPPLAWQLSGSFLLGPLIQLRCCLLWRAFLDFSWHHALFVSPALTGIRACLVYLSLVPREPHKLFLGYLALAGGYLENECGQAVFQPSSRWKWSH